VIPRRPPPIHAGEPPARGETLWERVIASRPEQQRPTIDALIAALRRRGVLTAPDQAVVRLCLDEALTNSMLHGNEGDPDLSLGIRLALEPTRWLVTISDAGTGFSPECIPAGDIGCDRDPDPAALRAAAPPPAVTAESGRGIRLLQAYLEELAYWRGGAVVVLGGRRADVPAPS